MPYRDPIHILPWSSIVTNGLTFPRLHMERLPLQMQRTIMTCIRRLTSATVGRTDAGSCCPSPSQSKVPLYTTVYAIHMLTIIQTESKAQLHFRQLAFLAGKVGRTIVLPNVYNSHMGSCLPHPFSFYYDLKWLDGNKKHFNYITMEDFKAWLLERHYAGAIPSGQEIYMQGTRKSRLLKKIKNCFSDSFDFSGRPTVSYQLQDHQDQRHINITDIMMDLFSDKARQHEYLDGTIQSPSMPGAAKKFKVQTGASSPPVDVINLFYDRRYLSYREFQL